MSTANDGGDGVRMVVSVPGNVASGESPRLEASTGMIVGTASVDAEPGVESSLVLPRRGLRPIAEMVEGLPPSGLQFMTRVGDFST